MTSEGVDIRKRKLKGVKRNYYGRLLTYVFFMVAVISTLIQTGESLPVLIYVASFFLLFPHLALFYAQRARNVTEAEKNSILCESFCEGTLYAILSFSLLPVFLIFIIGIIYKFFYAGTQFLLKSLLFNLIGIAAASLIIGFNVDLQTPYPANFLSAGFMALLTILMAVFIKFDTERSRLKIRKAQQHMEDVSNRLSKYLSPQVYQQIVMGQKEVKVESYDKHITIFFSLIQDFGKLTDSMESESLLASLNAYFDEMAKIAAKYNCTIDKFMVNSIMIFFGDSNSKGPRQDALECIQMAEEMQQRLEALRGEWLEEGNVRNIHIGIGIGAGICTVGNFGSEERIDYTIVGTKVNACHKLSLDAAKDEILISEDVFELVGEEMECEKIIVDHRPQTRYRMKNRTKDAKKFRWSFENSGWKNSADHNKLSHHEFLSSLKNSLESLEKVEN